MHICFSGKRLVPSKTLTIFGRDRVTHFERICIYYPYRKVQLNVYQNENFVAVYNVKKLC